MNPAAGLMIFDLANDYNRYLEVSVMEGDRDLFRPENISERLLRLKNGFVSEKFYALQQCNAKAYQ
jgi:hypothetical protein